MTHKGVLLVGGKSERMGSDKARLLLDDSRRFVDATATALASACDQVVLVGREEDVHLEPKDARGDRLVVESHVDAGQGPLQALAPYFVDAGVDWETLTVVPVDAPGVRGPDLRRLQDAATDANAIAHFVTGASDGGQEKTLALPVCIPKGAAPAIARAIAAGERALAKTLAKQQTKAVGLSREAARRLSNLNTPEDVERFARHLEQEHIVTTRKVEVVRLRSGERNAETTSDVVAEEEPLEIRVQGVSVAVTMRTPGHDEDLVRGFLMTEGVVEDPSAIVRVAHCERVEDPEAEENVIDARLREGLAFDVESLRRHTFAHSSCGVCGKATLEAALARGAPLDDSRTLAASVVAGLPDRLRDHQAVFDRTGGLHAAGLLRHEKARALAWVREDVGRHNAIDKVVGAAIADWSNGSSAGLCLVVSGRVSFEVVQKAARAKWPIVAAISAPTSLAVRLADTLGVTLVGFVREGSMVVYTHPQRIRCGD